MPDAAQPELARVLELALHGGPLAHAERCVNAPAHAVILGQLAAARLVLAQSADAARAVAACAAGVHIARAYESMVGQAGAATDWLLAVKP